MDIDGLMPSISGFPLSRDWIDIDCKKESCIYNQYLKCGVPSICKIGKDGKCEGYIMRGQ